MITIIAAIDRNRVMGRDNNIPWHLPSDMKHFKKVTMGYPMIMGHNTWKSFGEKPLPGRTHIVVSRNPSLVKRTPDVVVVSDLSDAISEAKSINETVFVIGGAQIYEQTMPLADRMIITHLKGVFLGDTYFPIITPNWKIKTDEYTGNPQSCNDMTYCIVDYYNANI